MFQKGFISTSPTGALDSKQIELVNSQMTTVRALRRSRETINKLIGDMFQPSTFVPGSLEAEPGH